MVRRVVAWGCSFTSVNSFQSPCLTFSGFLVLHLVLVQSTLAPVLYFLPLHMLVPEAGRTENQ